MNNEIDLRDNLYSDLLLTLKRYPEINKAVVFGSRALKTNEETSDIDISIFGQFDYKTFNSIQREINNVHTLLSFDINNFESLKNENLKKHIETEGKVIYLKSEDTFWQPTDYKNQNYEGLFTYFKENLTFLQNAHNKDGKNELEKVGTFYIFKQTLECALNLIQKKFDIDAVTPNSLIVGLNEVLDTKVYKKMFVAASNPYIRFDFNLLYTFIETLNRLKF